MTPEIADERVKATSTRRSSDDHRSVHRTARWAGRPGRRRGRGALSSRAQVEGLEHSESVESFNHQLNCSTAGCSSEPAAASVSCSSPRAWRPWPGSTARADFTKALWSTLLREDARCSCASSGTCWARSACSPGDRRPPLGQVHVSDSPRTGRRATASRRTVRGADRARLRPGQSGLPRLHEPRLHRPGHRPARVAGGHARQAVLRQALVGNLPQRVQGRGYPPVHIRR